ncbi:MAG: PEP-CTERM sorting domain-containing protein [Microcoleaceae cyanobacterium]
MDIKHGIAIKGFLWTTPVVTGLCVAISASSSYAATFALSEAQVKIDPISHSAFVWETTTEANTFAAASPQSHVAAIASATAQGMNINLGGAAFNQTQSIASGEGYNYLGVAHSTAAIIGTFSVGKNETFAFNFRANLDLFTSIDDPSKEDAYAQGKINFKIINTSTGLLLDSFSLFGNLGTQGVGSYGFNTFGSSFSGQMGVSQNLGGNQQNIGVGIDGFYARIFDDNTSIALIEDKDNLASVPEPSTVLGSALFMGLLNLLRQRKRQFLTSNAHH